MTSQMLRVLRKLYNNYEYDRVRSVCIYSDSILSDKERSLLLDCGWKTNEVVSFSSHDDVLNKLLSLKEKSSLSKKRCLDAFVAGVGGSYLRGRSVLAAWHYLNTLPLHDYEEKQPFACCWICAGHDKPKNINNSEFQYCLHLGNAYSSDPMYAYLNLHHLLASPPVTPTEEDCSALRKLFELLRTSSDDETPGKFEKRLTEAKIISGNKYTKRGVLVSLAKVGVIPNRFVELSDKTWTPNGDIALLGRELQNMQGRSDMEMPWAGWGGSLKINEERARELFGDYITF